MNQEEKEYSDFINKLARSAFELKSDFGKLSNNNKTRVIEYVVRLVKTQSQLEILNLTMNHP